MRALAGGCALGFAAGWNVANTGAVAAELADRYDVGLAVVGLFTTALFLAHLAMQIPGGRASDRFGPRRAGLAGLVVIASANAVALAAPAAALALAARTLAGVGLGLVFLAGAAYVREQGGSPFAQGLFGGIALAGGGVAIAVVPQAGEWMGWRAPYATAIGVAVAALLLLAAGPPDLPRGRAGSVALRGILGDGRLYRLAVVFAASFGLSIVVGNWVVTLLGEGGTAKGTAGAIGALTLALGVVGRPLGGWIVRERPGWTRGSLAASLAAGALGTGLLAASGSPALAAVGAAIVGTAAGLPFAPAFTGAAAARPEAPATAIGFVNGAAALTVVAGTPLLGLTFSLPGDGRLGFVLVAALWAAALLALPSERELGLLTPASESPAG